jgi:hypothetical protein
MVLNLNPNIAFACFAAFMVSTSTSSF